VKTSMAPREPTLASCKAQQVSCEAKVPCGPPTISSNEINLALPELATAPVGANLASRRVRDGSLHLASGELTPAYSNRMAEVSRIALNRAKAQDRLSSEAKAKAPCDANSAQPHNRANIASLKAPARSYIASFASSSKAKALCANSASTCEDKSHSEIILTSPETKKKSL